MKQIPLILTVFFSLYVKGQISPIQGPPIYIFNKNFDIAGSLTGRPDTSLRILYQNKPESEIEPAYFLDGKFVDHSVIQTINPKIITDINVERNDIEINSKKYHGQISIKTNQKYHFNFISLTELKTKYAKLKDAPTIFMINGEFINGDYDKFIVDQNYLLRINIETVENTKENLRLNLIQILTKTPENIKKVNEIRIRGDSSLTD